MRKISLLIVGVALGFIAAHCVNQTPEGRRFFERVNRGAREFGEAMAAGYRDGEAVLEETLDDVERRLRDLESKN